MVKSHIIQLNSSHPKTNINQNKIFDICGFIPNFQFISFSIVKNICNKAATTLATEALSSTSDQVWLEDCLVSFISLVQLDLIHE